jgi:hypothetical protein
MAQCPPRPRPATLATHRADVNQKPSAYEVRSSRLPRIDIRDTERAQICVDGCSADVLEWHEHVCGTQPPLSSFALPVCPLFGSDAAKHIFLRRRRDTQHTLRRALSHGPALRTSCLLHGSPFIFVHSSRRTKARTSRWLETGSVSTRPRPRKMRTARRPS